MTKWLFEFIKIHSDVEISVEYDIYTHAIVFRMNRYPYRKKFCISLEDIKNMDSQVLDDKLKYVLEDAYRDLERGAE